ncbi:MAG: 4Fe-4S dicluster domain-containing protein [Candidatus Adiutrix sp.]|nr:4Fe-4S dicluster domain-containing protein [Candidatus Adiutrix sp.]
MPRRRRLIQALSLALFLGLLGRAAPPLAESFPPVDFFLRLDPLAALALPLAARQFLAALWPGLAVLGTALVAGRLFCGYVCPLGTTLDLARALGHKIIPPRAAPAAGDPRPGLRGLKYLLLAAILGAAALGVNLAFWAAPMPLITRFYALLVHPLALLAGGAGLDLSRDLLGGSFWPLPDSLALVPRRYATLGFVLFFFGALFGLERLRPRFWCRYLCPAGALLGLCSRRPWRRRQVAACRHCGRCASVCPTGAPGPPDYLAPPAECLACQNCVNLCPAGAVSFGPGSAAPPLPGPGLSRRHFLAAGAGGLALAAAGLSGPYSLLKIGATGAIRPSRGLRPPGAKPEPEFLALCLRCGECLKVCPTNGLQAAWLEAGPDGLFSPVLLPRRGPCEPECRACGQVCPTGAILKLPLAEKYRAKVGTAVVLMENCLAWADGRSCVVCQEVCPYGAVRTLPVPGSGVHGPKVTSNKCFGCGYCEHFCPVALPAVVVRPHGALRLSRGPYRPAAEAAGLDLTPTSQVPAQAGPDEDFSQDRLPPGFTDL